MFKCVHSVATNHVLLVVTLVCSKAGLCDLLL